MDSGFIIPGSAAEKPTRGIVTAKGADVSEVNVNDVVLYERNAGIKTVINGKEMLVMDENRILGIIRE
jgi:co-chaperonin GroES (HSP10)